MAGIYIHIPFCKQACTYCNFHFSTSFNQKDALLNALDKEIIITATDAKRDKHIETIYIGGGTPSLLLPKDILHLIEKIKGEFNVTTSAEITLEANPDDITDELLQCWIHAGINRLSLGIQSFNENELQWMNRAHNATQARQSIQLIKQSAINNFSVDLIFGSPLLSNEDLANNLQYIIDQDTPHVSAYALTVEPKTLLHHMINHNKSTPIDEDKQAEQFEILVDKLTKAGYEHYEISNFAKPGFRSKHNSSYWQGKPYYGFGPSAHSYDGKNTRSWNINNNLLYIQSLQKNILPAEKEHLTEEQRFNEYVMISLRTTEGIDLALVADNFGTKASENILKSAATYLDQRTLKLESKKLKLTSEGKFFADGIAAGLFL